MRPAPAPEKKQFDPVPAGTHVARFIEIINIGSVETEWEGQKRLSHKIRLGFELCNERKVFKEGEQEKPYTISREFTYSMGEKSNLRPVVEGMIGATLTDEEARTFDLEKLLGTACLLNVVHVTKGDSVYANIKSASPLLKGITAPEQFNKSRLVDVDTATEEVINSLPQFIAEKMRSSQEYKTRTSVGMNGHDEIKSGDIPF
jgi:hypothetical protein